jgi:hypothetical protein
MKIIIRLSGTCSCSNKKIIGAFEYYMDKNKNCCAEFDSKQLQCKNCGNKMDFNIDYIKVEE